MNSANTYGQGNMSPLATKHFFDQAELRGVPKFVQEAFYTSCVTVCGHSPDGTPARFRIVRVSAGYYVSPAREGNLLSAYFVPNGDVEAFFRVRLANLQRLSTIRRMPITKSPEEDVMEELRELWLK